MSTVKFDVEHTDTFGGQANYCWVNRKTIEVPEKIADNDSLVIRYAKKELGLSGIRHKKSDFIDCIRLDLVGMCQVVFISLNECEEQ